MTQAEFESGWHLDKRVPVALIAMLFLQTVGVVWFMSDLSSRVGQSEKERASITERVAKIEVERGDLRERIVRVEAGLDNVTKLSEQILREVQK